jgi:hypothetical protein
MKLEFSRKVIEKYSHVKLHENIFSGSRVFACGQDGRTERRTDRHDEANGRFSQFENAPKNWLRNGKYK